MTKIVSYAELDSMKYVELVIVNSFGEFFEWDKEKWVRAYRPRERGPLERPMGTFLVLMSNVCRIGSI